MKVSLGISPCPNDTYIFDALVHQKIDTKGIEFDLHLADVEELNELAFHQQLDVTKLSYHAFSYLTKHYSLLSSGSALGNNCGPLLIANENINKQDILNKTVGLPGEYTTAHFLFNYYLPDAKNKQMMRFDKIEDAVLNNEVDAGVIIHENRFTYQEKGLTLLQDLGQYWEEKTLFPIPLGGIVIHNRIESEIAKTINLLIRQSIQYANQTSELPEFVTNNAQEMSQNVMKQHIELYVNQFSIELGETGKQAVTYMVNKANQTNHLNIIS